MYIKINNAIVLKIIDSLAVVKKSSRAISRLLAYYFLMIPVFAAIHFQQHIHEQDSVYQTIDLSDSTLSSECFVCDYYFSKQTEAYLQLFSFRFKTFESSFSELITQNIVYIPSISISSRGPPSL